MRKRYSGVSAFYTLTVVTQNNSQLNKRLQKDSISIGGKVIFINPFLYWRRFDSNTDRWLREPGQLTEEQICSNRSRFYPELDWEFLSEDNRSIKDGAVEMFLKTLDLISTYHPELTSGQLLEIERKMSITKKIAFENWVEKTYRRRFNQAERERQRFERERFLRSWKEWLSLETTHHAFVPLVASIVIAGFIGWSAGVSRNSCTPFFNSMEDTQIKMN